MEMTSETEKTTKASNKNWQGPIFIKYFISRGSV